MPGVVSDTTVLSNFAHAQRPDFLQSAFPNLAVPPAVRSELRQGEQEGRIPVCDWDWLQPIALSEAQQQLADDFSQTLGRGESECIALALERGWLLLTDDRDARRVAVDRAVSISGTLGSLVILVDRQVLSRTEADDHLRVMIASGYHSPVRSLSELDL